MIKVIKSIIKTKIKDKETRAVKSKYSNIICDIHVNKGTIYKVKKRNKYKKLKIYIKSTRRKRVFSPYKFLNKYNKHRYKKYNPILQNFFKRKFAKGIVTPKLNIKNLLEIMIYIKKKVILLKKKLYKKRGKRIYKWRWKNKRKFRRSGFYYVKKKKGRFQRLKRLNKRIFLFTQKKKNNLIQKGERNFKFLNILNKKYQKSKQKIIRIIKTNSSNRKIFVKSFNIKIKQKNYKKVTKNTFENSMLGTLRKTLQLIGILQLGNRNKIHRKQRISILRSIVKVMYRIPYRVNYFINKIINNRKITKKSKVQRLKIVTLWKSIANKILHKIAQIKTKKNNLNLLYKEKLLELGKNGFKVGTQRQKNNLRIITLLIAKKRDFCLNSEKFIEKSEYIKNETLTLNRNVPQIIGIKNLDCIINLKNIPSIINSFEKQKPIYKINKTKLFIFNKYLQKNKLRTSNTIKVTPIVKQKAIQVKNFQIKFLNKDLRRPLNKKFVRNKKLSFIEFKQLNQNIKLAINNVAVNLKAKVQKKKIRMSIGPKVMKRLHKTSNCRIWLKKIYKNLHEPFSLIRQQNRKVYKKNNNKQRVFKKKNNKKKEVIWLKKSKFQRRKFKRKKRGKRGRINLEKRRKISKLAYYIRPRIINQKGLQEYSKHLKNRGLLFNLLHLNKNKLVKLTKKVYTKEKKEKLLKQLLVKYFANHNKQAIIEKLKTIHIKNYLNQKGTRFLNNTTNNFIQEYIKIFYVLLDSKILNKKVEEKKTIQKVNKQLGLLYQKNLLGFKIKKITKNKFKIKSEQIRKWFKLYVASKMVKPYVKKKDFSLKNRKEKLKKITKKKNQLIINKNSYWGLKKRDRLRLESLRRKGSSVSKYYYKHKKCSIKRIKNISKKILKEHKKAKKNGQQIDKNLIKASYFYYFKRLRYDRVLLDKLNFKKRDLNMALKNKIKLSKFLLYLLMRVYIKKTQLKRTNVRKGKRKIKKITKKRKITRKIKIVGVLLNDYTKLVRRRSKKYIGIIKKTIIIKVLIKILRSLLKSTSGDKREIIRRRKIKEIIKIFLYPLLINKRQIKKIRLRKKNKIYLIMAQIFLYNIKQIIQSNSYSINFFGIIGSSITAEYVMRRLMERLEQCKKTGFWLIPKAMKRLMNSKHIVGFKMKFSGRLTGNSMAQQSIMKKGIIGNSNMNVYIDYAQDTIIRKHGKCGLKIWIIRNLLTYMPYKYVYTYNFKK
jgi:hypothetical protein